MAAIIYISGQIGKETTLVDVIRQFKAYEEPTEVLVKIHSEGGDVDEGEKIYNYLDKLKDSIPVNTETTKAYSISAKIFSVGEKRVVELGEKRIMIHFAWGSAKGNAETFERVAKELREFEDEFANYYSELLSVDEETARGLLDSNTFLNSEEAVDLGFATEIKEATKAVALYNTNTKTNKMGKGTKKSKWQELFKAMAKLVEIDENIEINALELQDSNGKTIDFPDVEDGENPVVGSMGNIDGEAVKDGSYIMPSWENKTLVFVDGKVTEIIDEVEETEVEIEARELLEEEARIAAEEEIQQISIWEMTASNTSFEVGDQMTYDFDGETLNYSAGEFYVPSLGKNVVTDASGIIVAHKDKTVVETSTTDNDDVDVEAMLVKLEKDVEARISAKYEAKFVASENEVRGMLKKIGSREINAILEAEVNPPVVEKKTEGEANSLASGFSKLKQKK